MSIGDLVEIYIVPVSPMFGPGTPEFAYAGIIVDLENVSWSKAKYLTCLTLDGDTQTLEVGLQRPDFFFNVEILSQVEN